MEDPRGFSDMVNFIWSLQVLLCPFLVIVHLILSGKICGRKRGLSQPFGESDLVEEE